MKDAYVCGNDWREYDSKRPSRPYPGGIDSASRTGDKNVYAAADGTVVKTGFNSANGNYVIIKHKLSGTTVYSFYAHLKSISASSGKNISKGTKIGVFGNTGSGSAGTHLHFAITDKLSNNGGYYGYVGSFSGNKTTYPEKTGTTFYNPHYVIKYNKLPMHAEYILSLIPSIFTLPMLACSPKISFTIYSKPGILLVPPVTII